MSHTADKMSSAAMCMEVYCVQFKTLHRMHFLKIEYMVKYIGEFN